MRSAEDVVGLRPRRHYTVNDALDDWLANGLDGLAPSTVTLYRNTIAKVLREELGTVKLTSLTAGAVPPDRLLSPQVRLDQDRPASHGRQAGIS